jgi:hypothetical protein
MALQSAPFETIEREHLALQKQLLRSARSERERLQIKRLIAQDILNGADGAACSKDEFDRALRRVQRLGYADVQARVHVACLLTWAALRFPEKASAALAMLEDAERRVRRLRRSHLLRAEALQGIAQVRKVAVAYLPGQ